MQTKGQSVAIKTTGTDEGVASITASAGAEGRYSDQNIDRRLAQSITGAEAINKNIEDDIWSRTTTRNEGLRATVGDFSTTVMSAKQAQDQFGIPQAPGGEYKMVYDGNQLVSASVDTGAQRFSYEGATGNWQRSGTFETNIGGVERTVTGSESYDGGMLVKGHYEYGSGGYMVSADVGAGGSASNVQFRKGEQTYDIESFMSEHKIDVNMNNLAAAADADRMPYREWVEAHPNSVAAYGAGKNLWNNVRNIMPFGKSSKGKGGGDKDQGGGRFNYDVPKIPNP